MGQFTNQGANPMLMQMLQGIFQQGQGGGMGGMQRPQMQQPQAPAGVPWLNGSAINTDALLQAAQGGDANAMNSLRHYQNMVGAFKGSGNYEQNLQERMGGLSMMDADRIAGFNMNPQALVNPLQGGMGTLNPQAMVNPQVPRPPAPASTMQAIPSFINQQPLQNRLLGAKPPQMPKFGEML